MNILVTGGSSGLGKTIVYALSNSPQNKVFFTYNKHSAEARVIATERHNVIAIKCDFTNVDEVCELEKAIPTYDLDVLITNAYIGLPQGTHFHKTIPESVLKSFENNIIPIIRLTQNAILGFKKKKFGKIINILTAYLINLPPVGFSIYTANKAYLQQLSKCWNSEYSRYNITSNCISPEFMQTNLSSSVDERIIEQMQANHPLNKLLTPEEVTETVVFLVNSSQQVNGAHIVINAAQNIL
jgi:NAD(P)-dependent dehydrogenase (short-subunit alcohol dehydrogenase family)